MAEFNDPFKKAIDNPFDRTATFNKEDQHQQNAQAGLKQPEDYPERVADSENRGQNETGFAEGNQIIPAGRSGDLTKDSRVAAMKATFSDNDPAKFDTDPFAKPLGMDIAQRMISTPNVSETNPLLTKEQEEQRKKVQEREQESRQLQVQNEKEANEKRARNPEMRSTLKAPTVPEETRREIEKILFEYDGMEGNIPLNHRYWQLKNERAPGS